MLWLGVRLRSNMAIDTDVLSAGCRRPTVRRSFLRYTDAVVRCLGKLQPVLEHCALREQDGPFECAGRAQSERLEPLLLSFPRVINGRRWQRALDERRPDPAPSQASSIQHRRKPCAQSVCAPSRPPQALSVGHRCGVVVA